MVAGCRPQARGIQRIALLAPFEGHLSEIGYDAYYAVRLALADSVYPDVELLAVDDGLDRQAAVERAKALANDPLVKVILALGPDATRAEVQTAVGDIPFIIIGNWQAKPAVPNAYVLTNKHTADMVSPIIQLDEALMLLGSGAHVVGGDIFALKQLAGLHDDLTVLTLVSSAQLPSEAFRQHYLTSGQFVPEPGLLTTLSYDAAGMALQALAEDNAQQALRHMDYAGINGRIRFVDGYWADAPINTFVYNTDGTLMAEDGAIKQRKRLDRRRAVSNGR